MNRRLRVAHAPGHHPYVDHLGLDDDGIGVITVDVNPWELDHVVAAEIDAVHVHFGFEQLDADALAGWADGLRRAGIVIVYTVHDLDNPHLVDQGAHHAAVATLADRADAVITLTDWAATELRRRTGVDARVVPHPHVVPLDDLRRRPSVPPAATGVYVHAATLRPNLDTALLEYVARHTESIGGLHVHVRAHPCGHADAPAPPWLTRLSAIKGVAVDVADRLSDGELWDRIAASQYVLLPYRWGTHSGILEAARDLGVVTVAPTGGGYGDQGAITYDDAAHCVERLQARLPHAPVLLGERLDQRRSLGRVHEQIYEQAVASVRVGS